MNKTSENRFSLDVAGLDAQAVEQFEAYLALLMKWNGRMNLTAARKPEEIVRRHFADSIFAAQQIPKQVKTLLDFGSGAGFPGIPIAICRPKIGVALAESQGKKAAFLREAVQAIGSCTTANPNPNPNPESFAAVATSTATARVTFCGGNTSTEQVYEWLMNGTTFTSSGSPGSPTSDWVIQGVAISTAMAKPTSCGGTAPPERSTSG
jgi:hypothetical protein